ncbi:hypothetical protein QR680_010043 [Steinernema hermaphroditum]|uniref:Uncharacterized protein n=1 Tax=Steinernema hermaphroditum TaxID=289476 RepID=A0AA39IMI2_9BILA|nr:hypothetical protein QR680_010043 [Steinernema hermaphroditum]
MGILQNMCSPAPFFFGLTQLLNYDYFSVASFTNKLGMVVIRTEGILNFLLALNRMKIVCEVKIHPVVFKSLTASAYIYFLLNNILYCSPWADMLAVPGIFYTFDDFSRPYTALISEISGTIYQVSLCSTFLAYVAIVSYVAYKKRLMNSKCNTQRERHIIIYAFTRFLIDLSLSVITHYISLPKVPLTGFITYSCYCLNTLFVPPFLYLCLNASLREEFFGRKKTAKVAAVRSVIGSMKA